MEWCCFPRPAPPAAAETTHQPVLCLQLLQWSALHLIRYCRYKIRKSDLNIVWFLVDTQSADEKKVVLASLANADNTAKFYSKFKLCYLQTAAAWPHLLRIFQGVAVGHPWCLIICSRFLNLGQLALQCPQGGCMLRVTVVEIPSHDAMIAC